jgi:ABC-type transporter MlaC component
MRAIALAVLIVAAPGASAANPAAEAAAQLEPVLAEIVATAHDAGSSPAAKRALIEHQLATWLDYGHMATVALGPLAERLSSRQLAEFSQEFQRYLADVYIRRVARFDEERVEIEGASADSASGIVMARTRGGAPLGAYRDLPSRRMVKGLAQVEYAMQRRHGDWRIIAIRVGGVDLARNFGEQFQSVPQRSDPDALIAELRKRNAEREAQNPWSS